MTQAASKTVRSGHVAAPLRLIIRLILMKISAMTSYDNPAAERDHGKIKTSVQDLPSYADKLRQEANKETLCLGTANS